MRQAARCWRFDDPPALEPRAGPLSRWASTSERVARSTIDREKPKTPTLTPVSPCGWFGHLNYLRATARNPYRAIAYRRPPLQAAGVGIPVCIGAVASFVSMVVHTVVTVLERRRVVQVSAIGEGQAVGVGAVDELVAVIVNLVVTNLERCCVATAVTAHLESSRAALAPTCDSAHARIAPNGHRTTETRAAVPGGATALFRCRPRGPTRGEPAAPAAPPSPDPAAPPGPRRFGGCRASLDA